MATSAVARLLRLRLLPPVMKKGRMSSAAPLILPSATSARAADGFFFSFVKCGFSSSVSPVIVAFCLGGNVSFPNNVFVIFLILWFYSLTYPLRFSSRHPGRWRRYGRRHRKGCLCQWCWWRFWWWGSEKGDGKEGKIPRMKWIVSKTWDLYRKMVRPMEHLNRVGNSIGIIVGAGIYIYAMVFINDEDAVAKEMQNFFKKLSKFIRDDDDEGLTGLTLSLKEICGIPVQMEIIIKQNREIIRKLEKVTEEIDRNKGCGHGESEGEGKQNDGDGRGK